MPPQPEGSPGAQTINEARNTVEADLNKAAVRFDYQKWTLFAGALFYIAGHVMHMATIPSKPCVQAAEQDRPAR